MATVTFQGTRLNAADSNTNWANFNATGPSPGAEPQLKYQGSNAVNKKITSTSSRTGVAYEAGAANLSSQLWFSKIYVADFGDLNATYGVELAVGSSGSNYYSYNIAGTGANNSTFNTYPSQGGYLIVALNPNVVAWRESTTGSPNLTNCNLWGVAAQFVTGGAKSENLAMDAVDVGTGLLLNGTSGSFQDFLTFDQDNTSNRYGVVTGNAPTIEARGLLEIGDATQTTFSDSTSVVLFQDGYHGAGDVGISVDLQAAGTDVTVDCSIIGLGSADTRPDFSVSGAGAGSTCLVSGIISNHRNVTLNSQTELNGATVECDSLTQGSADITDSILITTSGTNVACIDDVTLGSTTGLNNTTFELGTAGHAIEITSPGTYNFVGLVFNGYSGTGGNAAVYNNSGGAVTINVSGGGNTPSVRDGAGASTTVNNTVSVLVTVVDNAGSPIQDARVLVEAAAGGDLAAGTDIISGVTDVNGQIVNAGFNYTNDQPVTGRARKSTSSPLYKTGNIIGTILNTGFSTTVVMIADE